MNRAKLFFLRISWGEASLRRAFWGYYVLGGQFLVPIGLLALVLVPGVVVTLVIGLPLPPFGYLYPIAALLIVLQVAYIWIASVGVWHSAERYDGAPAWAFLAKAAVLLWGVVVAVQFVRKIQSFFGYPLGYTAY